MAEVVDLVLEEGFEPGLVARRLRRFLRCPDLPPLLVGPDDEIVLRVVASVTWGTISWLLRISL